MTTGKKYNKDKLFAKISHGTDSGVVGQAEYEVLGEVKLSVASTFTTSGTLTVQGRIQNSSSWQTVGTLTSGGDFDTFDIDAYDYVRFNFTVAAGSSGEIAASGFFKASAAGGAGATTSFTTIQTDAGTSPVADTATDTLTFTSSDASLTITGNSTTDTIDLTVASSSSTLQDAYDNSTDPEIAVESARGLTLKANASQTDNILNITDSSDTVIAGVAADGTVIAKGSSGSTDASIERANDTDQYIAMYGSTSNHVFRFVTGNQVLEVTKNSCTLYSGNANFRSGNRGTAGQVMFGYRADMNTGMYSPSADELGFSAGGVNRLNISTTAVEANLPLKLAQYTTAGLPTASSFEGHIVYDTDTNTVKFSDGSTWTSL